jgi:hypothetical protein
MSGTKNVPCPLSWVYYNEPLLRTQKTPENAHSMGFSGVRESISFRSLLIHLFCELSLFTSQPYIPGAMYFTGFAVIFDCSKTATFQPYPQILFWGKIHFAF